MKRILLFLVFCLAVALGLLLTENAHAQRPPLVLAFYYNWFDENTWRADKVPDMPAQTYVSRDPNAMARHIRQARDAGIDAFIVSWWGAGNQTDDNLKVMLDLARGMDFRVGVDFELTSPFYRSKDDVIRSLKNLMATHVNHPAYARSEGKPIIFFWRQQHYSVDEWQAIRNQVDPERRTLWIAEGLDVSYLRVFDGHHLYMIAWAPNPQAELNKWPRRIAAFGADKIWVATVNPGADNRKTTQSEKVVRDRQNGEYYRETWRAAFTTYPDWIMITSWNEWPEGTMIEPSVSYGNLYLDITREYAAQFKRGLPTPTPTSTRTPTQTPSPTATATITPSGRASISITRTTPLTPPRVISSVRATISDTIRVRAKPTTASENLGFLREGMPVTLLGQSEDGLWYQIPYPNNSMRGWIFGGFVDPDDDPAALRVLSAEEQAPLPSPTATLSPTPTFTPTFEPTLIPETPTATPTLTPTPRPTATPTPAGFSLRSIFPFLP